MKDGSNALYVAEMNIEAIMDKFKMILDDKELMKKLPRYVLIKARGES